MITAIYIGSERLDLFKEDNIVIKSKVSDIEDITKIYTDTSNSFNVPASSNNNAIFKHYYNANVLNGFDARKKVPAVIELNGLNYKVGKIKLNKVQMKSNKPSSYDIDFFGNLVSLKDTLGDDKLSDLDLSSFDFEHNYTNVSSKLQAEGDIIFSLFSNRRYLYDSSNATVVNTEQTNIYYNGTDGNSGVKYNEPKGSIKNLKLIEAIETKYNLTFSRDFFDVSVFSKLYLLLSGREVNSFEEEIPIVNTNDPTVVGNVMLAGSESGTYYIKYSMNVIDASELIPYTVIVKSDGVVIYEQTLTGDNFDKLYFYNYITYEKITFHIKSDEPLRYDFSLERHLLSGGNYTANTPPRTMVSDYIISDNVPDIKIIDYLKGLFKTYKLVAIPQKDGSIYVDSLSNYYRNGVVYNIDKYVDYKSHPVSSGKMLNEINYNFEDSNTILNKQFKANNDVGYGDLELSIYDNNSQLIDGEKLDYDVPFEQVVYERLIDIDGVDAVNIQYALLADENIKPVKPKAHLHYNYNTSMDSPIKLLNELSVGAAISTMNLPIHTLDIDSPVYSTVFGEEFNEYNGNLITETIFKLYHQTYIEGVFSEKRRVCEITAKNLPSNIVLNLGLNDILEIKEQYYRIDSMDTNIITGEVKFKLLNAINLNMTPDVITSGGWGYYRDGEITTPTQTINTTPSLLLIDGTSSLSNNSQLPEEIRGISDLWESNKIEPINSGDIYEVQIDIEITNTTGSPTELTTVLDIGGSGSITDNLLEIQTPLPAGTVYDLDISFTTTSLGDFMTNGGQIFFSTDVGTMTISGRGILILRPNKVS